ncbi:MAG: AAA domain-containing protein [Crocinitomicaceae bacterium]|nr:AAA domain-containing protein [Crocinitomicaceae bacterium]
MNKDEKQLLQDWMLQLSEFNKNDLLVSFNVSTQQVFQEILPIHSLEKTIAEAQISIKESGVNPLCQTIGYLNWEYNNQSVQTPIWLIPLDFENDKVRKQVSLLPKEEEGFVNPFLLKKLNDLYAIQLDNLSKEEVFEALKLAGLESINTEFLSVGNFHHHRYVLLKELQGLLDADDYSDALAQLLTGEKKKRTTLQFTNETLLPYDVDHWNVMELFANENCVVQGPPGTGKSQLLTNIVAKTILGDYTTIFVSEKKAALDVVKKRLELNGVGVVAIVDTDELTTHQFLQDLKMTWEFFESYKIEKKLEISVRNDLEKNLQFILDVLNQPELIGGVSFQEFNELKKKLLKKATIEAKPSAQFFEETNFISNPPELRDFEHTVSIVEKLYTEKLAESSSLLNLSALQQSELRLFADKIKKLKEIVLSIEQQIPGLTYNDLAVLQHQQIVYQLFQNELAKKYKAIIEPESKSQKKFDKLFKKYKQTQKQLEDKNNLTDWIQLPSDLQLAHLKELSESTSLLKKIQFNRRWKKVNQLPKEKALDAIERLIDYRNSKQKLVTLEQKFNELGVYDLTEIDQIKASLHLFSKEKWTVYNQLKSLDKVILQQLESTISMLKNELRTGFNLDANQSIMLQLDKITSDLPKLLVLEQDLKKLTPAICEAMAQSATFSLYLQNVLKSHQVIFQSHYPSFSSFSGEELEQRVLKIIDEQKKENSLVAKRILNHVKQTFEAYNALINTASTKLTTEEKLLKQRLKKGKSVLVKEFAKTRQHPTMRELMSSDAYLWIKALKPVWLSNPTRLAKTFPLDKELFDVCIMDEASQMPLQNGVGALQRSKYVIIAGDEQQMNPTSYFQSSSKQVVSLLHHASYYLTNYSLSHHYRSKHAPLIAFSNENFYENNLVVYPSFPNNTSCIQRHFCDTGRFINRRNVEEAKKVVELLKSYLKQEKTIGIVAFSMEQVDAVWKAIPSDLVPIIQEKIDENKLFIKPLEKVQGDECEHLIISLGYAPDDEGKFSLHFGPLNTESGRNRLNVLFSRASETIDFVCSIHSSAVQWSDNESIQVLYKWLFQLEQSNFEHEIEFPLGIQPEIKGNQLIISNVFAQIKNAIELITTYSVLSQRGWDVKMNY